MHSYFNRAKKDTGQSNIVAQNRMAGGLRFNLLIADLKLLLNVNCKKLLTITLLSRSCK